MKRLVRFTPTELTREPAPGAVYQGDNVWLVDEGAQCVKEASEMSSFDARAACTVRYDLPLSHPLFGKRALRVVPAGSPDIIMSEEGVLEEWRPGVVGTEIE